MKPKTYWSIAGLFMISLILTLPFYSANALAVSVQITKNQGEDTIRGFIDAQGDVWTVEATITGAAEENIPPENVKIRIGQNEAPFNSCSASALGTACEYISPLTDGVQEGEYPFQVIYNFRNPLGVADSVSNGEVIRADGSGPAISFDHLEQNEEGQIELDFTVDERVHSQAPAVGIKSMEIVDANSGNVMQTIVLPATGVAEYNYRDDGNFNGVLQASIAGEGLRRLKVRATDWLGHESQQDPIRSFQLDTVLPVIEDSLNFTSLGRFIGSVVVSSDIIIRVRENNLLEVKAFSEQADLSGAAGECEEDVDEIGLHRCIWENVEISPVDTVAIRFVARDSKGNTAERVLSQSFVRDANAPEVEFLGTERQFEGRSYVKKTGTHRLLLRVNEQGSGMDADGIRANLQAFGRSSSETPTECEQSETTFNCFWDVQRTFTSSGVARIGLSRLRDNAGNEGQLQEIELFIDDAGPVVEKLEVFGVSEVGEKDYFQSNDRLKIKLRAVETTGLVVLINVNGVVMDARTVFPESLHTRDISPSEGWQAFTEDSCQRVEGKWECELFTEPIKSGPQSGVRLEIRVQDTAGNDAGEWPDSARNAQRFSSRAGDSAEYFFDLLGLTEEEAPDYWEVDRVVPLGGESAFIDLDVTHLAPPRQAFEIRLGGTAGNARLIGVELVQCTSLEEEEVLPPGGEIEEVEEVEEEGAIPAGEFIPTVSRSILVAGVTAEGDDNPKPKIVLEFEPFEGKELVNLEQEAGRTESFTTKDVPYNCQLLLFSEVSRNAIRAAEVQDVMVEVPFGYSQLGAPQANLDEIIKREREAASTGFWGFIGTFEKILRVLRYIAQIAQVITGAMAIIEGPSKKATDALDKIPGGKPAQIATCFGLNSATKGADLAASTIMIPLNILTCNPRSGIGWYDSWINWLPQYYNRLMNIEVLQSPDRPAGAESDWRPARGVYDNMYLSAAAFCVPGVIHNLDKYRQIKCRKVFCLENEVKANLATVSQCNELESQLTCKYFIGELWYILPFSQFYDGIINLFRQILRDPIALAHTATVLGCGSACFINSGLSGGCNLAYFIWSIVDYIERTVAFIFTIVDEFRYGGLQYCDSVGL